MLVLDEGSGRGFAITVTGWNISVLAKRSAKISK